MGGACSTYGITGKRIQGFVGELEGWNHLGGIDVCEKIILKFILKYILSERRLDSSCLWKVSVAVSFEHGSNEYKTGLLLVHSHKVDHSPTFLPFYNLSSSEDRTGISWEPGARNISSFVHWNKSNLFRCTNSSVYKIKNTLTSRCF
jgi:hypothetical protein